MAMSELKQKLLLYELAQIGFRDAQYHPASGRVQVQPDNDRMPIINDAGEIKYGTEYSSLAVNTLRPLVDRVNESVAAWERSRIMPFEDLSQFRVLAEYNNIVMAARDDTVYGRGLHFVTWQYNYDRTGLDHGHYSEDYNAVKEDFAGRSGLIPELKLFTPEHAAEVKASIDYRINNDGDLTYMTEDTLKSIAARLRVAYPEKDAGGNEEQKTEIQVEAEKTVSATNGEIRPGDWVIVASGGEYKYLIGQVTEITPLGSPEHDTGNLTDDIHVNFMDVEYSDERRDEIVEQLNAPYGESKPFGILPLDDVIMAPDSLIRISGAEISDIEYATFEELLDSRDAAEAYCNQALDSLFNAKLALLMERLNTNFTDYRDSLMDFGKGEIINTAAKIAAMSDAYDYLTTTYGFDESSIDYLLKFQNPLEVVADEWALRQSDKSDMFFAVDEVFDKQNALQGNYALMSDAPVQQAGFGNMEIYSQMKKSPEIRTPPEQAAVKQNVNAHERQFMCSSAHLQSKRTLGEKLHAAGEKVKAQNAHDNNTKSHKRDERS